MPALFATFLLLSFALAGAIAFSPPKSRSALKWLWILTLLGVWTALGLAVARIVQRTGATLVTPGGARQPHLVEQAIREGLTLLAVLGGPALLATILGVLALKATRPGKQASPPAG